MSSSPLDKLLSEVKAEAPSGADKTRALLQEALKEKPPVERWTKQWRNTMASSLALVALSAVLLFLSGNIDGEWLLHRAPSLAILAVTGAFCSWAALSPKAQKMRPWSLGLWLLAMVGMVVLRHDDAPPAVTPWFCTLGHLGIGLIPLWVALGALRNTAPGKLRWLLAGVFVGTTGAMSGELGCVGGLTHVAIYHLAAWWAMALVAVLLSLWVKTKSYAP